MRENPISPRDSGTILHAIHSGGFYGAEKVVHDLILHQARVAKLPVKLLAFLDVGLESNELADRLRREGIEVILFPIKAGFDLLALFRYARLLRRERPALVHCHIYKASFQHFATRMLGLQRVPFVITVHGYNKSSSENWKEAMYERLDLFMLGHAERVVCVSREGEAFVRANNPRCRLERIENGIAGEASLSGSHPVRDLLPEGEKDWPVIGAVGRLVAVKNHALLIRAYATVFRRRPCHLVLLGGGPLRDALRELAQSLSLGSRPHFIPFQDNVLDWVKDFDVFCMPSLSEGTPMSLLEAGLLGKAAVCSDVGGIPEVVTHGESGLLFPSGDEAALVSALESCLADGGLRARLGSALRGAVARNYGIGRASERYAALYADIRSGA